MTSDLTGARVLVTGGAKGLGLRTAGAILAGGGAVAIADIDEQAGADAVAALAQEGRTAVFVALDVTDDASWERASAEAVEALGGLSGVVNNAGIEISDLFVDLNPDSVRKILDVNVLGTALGIKHAFRAMRPEAPPDRAARSSTSPRSRPRSASRGSPRTRHPSPPSTGSRRSPPRNQGDSATACA